MGIILQRKGVDYLKLILLIFIFHSVFFIYHCEAIEVPPLRGYVNDNANMISPDAKAKIEVYLKGFEQSDSTQIVILTIPTLEGEDLEGYSIKVAEAWKIGQKGSDNGAILLVVKDDRKIRIEVGRGLEGRLTDLLSGQIIDRIIKPRFRIGDYDGGFTAAAQALTETVKGEFTAPAKAPARTKSKGSSWPVLIIFGLIILVGLGRISKILGGAVGAVGLPVVGLFMGASVTLLVILGVAGLAMGVLLPLLFGGIGRGGGGIFPGGFGGGGFGGGDFGGDSGGFSGGGGDFGGGGASGDW